MSINVEKAKEVLASMESIDVIQVYKLWEVLDALAAGNAGPVPQAAGDTAQSIEQAAKPIVLNCPPVCGKCGQCHHQNKPCVPVESAPTQEIVAGGNPEWDEEIEVGDEFCVTAHAEQRLTCMAVVESMLSDQYGNTVNKHFCTLLRKVPYEPGDGVEHREYPEWGCGTVIQFEGRMAARFPSAACTELDLSRVRRIKARSKA